MRVTSSLWVSAHMRCAQAGGAFVTLTSRGSEEAGAIFIVVNDLQGNYTLYGPAPQTEYVPGTVGGRMFEQVLSAQNWIDVTQYLDSQKRFDPDIWIVEIEDREARNFLQDHERVSPTP